MRRPSVFVALTLLAGCGSEPAARVPEAAITVQPAPESALAVADTGCRKTGLWQACSVEDRIVRAGLVIEPEADSATRDLFSVKGVAYKIGAGEDRIEVFVYPTVAARTADTDKLDSVSVSPRGERRSYRVAPLLVTSNNIAALVFTLNERSQERMSLALSAGLPPR